MTEARVHRRQFLKSATATGAAAAFPAPLLSQSAPLRVVVIGGGFGGASCARALRKADPRIAVTLVETNPAYTAPPMSSAAIAGLVELKHQQFGYDAIKRAGVTVILSAATAIEPQAQVVTLADATRLAYDRLVLSPGIDFRWNAIPGYDRAAAAVMPHAGDGRGSLLRRQLEYGGHDGRSRRRQPARCPPAPYERQLIAHYPEKAALR
jgi:NADPH-dependent 2,4-dienoyl-CoA reductase/sulfur reductase-like enzyme